MEKDLRKVRQRKIDNGINQDILELHSKILNLFEKENQDLDNLKNKLKKLNDKIKNTDKPKKQAILTEEIKNLQSLIYIIESGYREAEYLIKTEKILTEWTKLVNQPVRINFMSKNGSKIDCKLKEDLIIQFLSIAKNYIQVQMVTNKKWNLICNKCNIDLEKSDDALFTCSNCGYTIHAIDPITNYTEGNRANGCQRYVYDKKAHFGDSIKKFQGKQNTTIPQQVYNDVKNKISSHEINLTKLTKDHIYEFLKITKHTDHYEDITLIYYELTGIKPPDISHIEQRLFDLFDEIDPIYEQVKPIERVNFLNGQFVLFKLLQKLKYPCKEEDFYILKTRDKMIEHDEIWKKICEQLHWTFIPTV